MKRSKAIAAGALWLSAACTVNAQSSAESKTAEAPVIRTGVTGSVNASGLDDPQYVLSFVPVQKLMLEATRRPLTKEEIEKSVGETPVKLEQLIKLDLLRREGEQNSYRLNYLLLTTEDQKTMYRASARYGESLAEAFRAHKAQFEQIASRYAAAELRSELMFALVAGAALNWSGLDLTTELGYRVKPPRHANGSVYFVHSAEVGAQLDFRGLYLDSETAPGSKMSFSTFGDGDSLPRIQGLPDVFGGIEGATAGWKTHLKFSVLCRASI